MPEVIDLPCAHGVSWAQFDKRWAAVEFAGVSYQADTRVCGCCSGPALKAERCTRCSR